MKIKILSYNILTGFYDKDSDGKYVHNKKRQQIARNIVKAENPDIIILSESNWIKHPKIRQNYKKIFGYKYDFFASDLYNDDDWGVGIMSKFKIKKAFDYTTKQSRFVRAIIEVRDKEIMVDCVHPDPYHNEHQRAQWFKTVTRDRKNPYIIAGDFNAFSPEDKYDVKELIKGFEENYKPEERYKAKQLVAEVLTGKAIGVLLDAKLIDTFKAKNKKTIFSFHTPLLDKNAVHARIDYIFASEEIKIIDSGIIKNDLTEKASDHYPIYAIIEI